MNKEILIKLNGVYKSPDQENDPIDIVTVGEYFQRNGKEYILYEEFDETYGTLIKNRLKIEENRVEVSKKGEINSLMIFDVNEQSTTRYETPYGVFMLGIDTQNVQVQRGDDTMNIRIDYTLNLDREVFTRCTMMIDIVSRKTEE